MPTSESQGDMTSVPQRSGNNLTPPSSRILQVEKRQKKRSRLNLQNILNISKLNNNLKDSMLNDYQVILQRLAQRQNEHQTNLKNKVLADSQNNRSLQSIPSQDQRSFLFKLLPESKIVPNSQSYSNSPENSSRMFIMRKRDNKYSVEKHELLNNSQLDLDKFQTERNDRLDKI